MEKNSTNMFIAMEKKIEGSIFEKVSESIEQKNAPEKTFEIECRAVAEIERKTLDSLGVINLFDVGYIIVALRALAMALENADEDPIFGHEDPLLGIVKRKQIEHLEKAIQIVTVTNKKEKPHRGQGGKGKAAPGAVSL